MSLKDLGKTAALTLGIVLSQSGVSPEKKEAEVHFSKEAQVYSQRYHSRAMEIISLPADCTPDELVLRVAEDDVADGQLLEEYPVLAHSSVDVPGTVVGIDANCSAEKPTNTFPVSTTDAFAIQTGHEKPVTVRQQIFRYTFRALPNVQVLTQKHIGKLPFWKLSAVVEALQRAQHRSKAFPVTKISILPFHKAASFAERGEGDEVVFSQEMFEEYSVEELAVVADHEMWHHESRSPKFASLRTAFFQALDQLTPEQKQKLAHRVDEVTQNPDIFHNRSAKSAPKESAAHDHHEEYLARFLNVVIKKDGPVLSDAALMEKFWEFVS